MSAIVKPRDEVVGTVYGEKSGAHVPVLFLVVRGDSAGFVLEVGGAEFFEIIGDGSDVEAVENAMQRAEAHRAMLQ